MKVNDKFFSYDELKDAISRYGKETLQCFVKRDSVTIDSWCKKLTSPIIVDEKVKSDLKYQKVIFKCIHYKKEEIKSKGNGVRAECGYNGKECKVTINVGKWKKVIHVI